MTPQPSPNMRDLNWQLLALLLSMLALGLVMLTSASISVAENSTGRPFYFLTQQLVAAALGLLLGYFVLRTPAAYWEKAAPLLLLLALVLLAVVLIPGVGREVNGSRRWIEIAGVNVQVSEPARLLVLVYVCSYAVRHRTQLGQGFLQFLRPMLLVSVACGLLLLEPDFGATCVLLIIAMSVLFVAGVPLRHFILLSAGFLALLAAVAVSSPYRLRRLTGFTNPWEDPFGAGFQLTQSLIAIGSGQWLGAGLGNSVQKLFYLPEAHTDFVYAVIAEEFGFAGTVVVVVLFAALVWQALRIAFSAASRELYFQAYLAFGIAVWQGTQVFVNLGVNMGILPTKGLTLPLISYGRSSLIVTLIALALLLRIDMENRAVAERGKGRRR